MRISLLIAVGSLAIIQCYAIPLSTPKEGRSSELTPVQVEELGKIREETQGVFKKDEEIQKQSGGESESSPSSTEASQQAENSSQKQVEEKKDANEKSVLDDKKDENVEGAKREEKKLKEGARQSSGSDDDDDDDDDDDLDLGVDDDDDDDDDDESGTAADSDDDDDDDDDYFERFFDDILGEDDDDDDDDVSPSTGGQQPAQSSQQQPVASVNVETSIQEGSDSQEVVDNSGEGLQSETEATLDGTAEDTDADTLIDKDPSESAVQNTVQQPVVVEPVPADNNASSDDDDDDDDDEGDITDLTSDDDDDDDDDDDAADDDDEDDDDETDLDDVLEAKRSRALQPPKMSSIYVTKYNKFVDNIISRINRILGKSYDPVRVKLQSNDSKKKNKTKNKTTKRKSNKRKSMNRPRMPEMSNKMGDFEIARSNPNNEANETSYVLISKTASNAKSDTKNNTIEIRSNMSNKRRKSGSNSKNKKNKKGSSSKQAPRARATLFGLSSIKRDGDVVVNMLSNYTTVKTDFILGPLTLRVEKEFGRGAKKEVKSATATTAEMHGKLNLKIIHGGAATLSSIKVLQPRQVRVDSAENHEKTKEYVWKRSSHIATLVSQKLASAARSMLKPPPNKSLIEHLLSKQNK